MKFEWIKKGLIWNPEQEGCYEVFEALLAEMFRLRDQIEQRHNCVPDTQIYALVCVEVVVDNQYFWYIYYFCVVVLVVVLEVSTRICFFCTPDQHTEMLTQSDLS